MRRAIFCAVLTASLLALAGSAGAVSMLRFSVDSGAGWVTTATDQGGGDSHTTPGAVMYVGALPSSLWSVNVTVGITKPAQGDAVSPLFEVTSVNMNSPGAQTPLVIQFSDDNFGPLPWTYSFESLIGGVAPNASVLFDTWGDAGNVLFANDGVTAQSALGPFSGPFSGGSSAPQGGPLAFPYSLTIQVTISPTTVEAFSFDATLKAVGEPPPDPTVVPEPLTICGLILGVAGVARYVRKRRTS